MVNDKKAAILLLPTHHSYKKKYVTELGSRILTASSIHKEVLSILAVHAGRVVVIKLVHIRSDAISKDIYV